MKVTTNKVFSPVEVNFILESEEELKAFCLLFGCMSAHGVKQNLEPKYEKHFDTNAMYELLDSGYSAIEEDSQRLFNE